MSTKTVVMQALMCDRQKHNSFTSNCIYETGILRHGMFIFRTALATLTSLRAMATMTSLWGFPRALRRLAMGFIVGL